MTVIGNVWYTFCVIFRHTLFALRAILGTCKSARFASVDRLPFVLIKVLLLVRGGPVKLFYEARVNRMMVKPHLSEIQYDRKCQHVTFNILG